MIMLVQIGQYYVGGTVTDEVYIDEINITRFTGQELDIQ